MRSFLCCLFRRRRPGSRLDKPAQGGLEGGLPPDAVPGGGSFFEGQRNAGQTDGQFGQIGLMADGDEHIGRFCGGPPGQQGEDVFSRCQFADRFNFFDTERL